jgi:hypothetical protein
MADGDHAVALVVEVPKASHNELPSSFVHREIVLVGEVHIPFLPERLRISAELHIASGGVRKTSEGIEYNNIIVLRLPGQEVFNVPLESLVSRAGQVSNLTRPDEVGN